MVGRCSDKSIIAEVKLINKYDLYWNALIPTCESRVSFCWRGSGINKEIRVWPRALLKASDVITQDVEIGIHGSCCRAQLRIVGFRSLEQLNGEAGKDNICSIHLVGEAGQFVDLFGTKVGVDVTLECADEFGNGRYQGRTEEFLA